MDTPILSYVLFPYRISSPTSCSALEVAGGLPLDIHCRCVHSSRVQFILQWCSSENSLAANESRPSHLIKPSSVPVICAFAQSVPSKWAVASAGQQLWSPLTGIRARRCRQCPKKPSAMLIICFALWLPARLFTTQPAHLPLPSTIPKAAAVANHRRELTFHSCGLGSVWGFGLQGSCEAVAHMYRTLTVRTGCGQTLHFSRHSIVI